MPYLDHTALVYSRRDEQDLSHHTLRAYVQDLLAFADFAGLHQLCGFRTMRYDELCSLLTC